MVELLIPELRRRGLYAEKGAKDGLTSRERVYGKGQARLRDDHSGAAYKYGVYKEDPPYEEAPEEVEVIPEWAIEGLM